MSSKTFLLESSKVVTVWLTVNMVGNVGEGENTGFPFPTMFSKGFFLRTIKGQHFVVQDQAPFTRALFIYFLLCKHQLNISYQPECHS